jgi:hypothetical protein
MSQAVILIMVSIKIILDKLTIKINSIILSIIED